MGCLFDTPCIGRNMITITKHLYFSFCNTEVYDGESEGSPSKQPNSMDTDSRNASNAYEDEEGEYDLLEVAQEPDKGIQGSTRQKRKQKSKWVGPRGRPRKH